ncbi:EamA family transporter, partial [Serratia nevei]|nr:EamA family transporter [Serratia nevei]
MNAEIKRGSLEMTAAMLISGSIGWFVLMSGQPVVNVVFWRCAVGALVLLAVCGALGQL